jgi:hypothetical protein
MCERTMSRHIDKNTLKEIEEFNKKGFVRSSGNVLYYLRSNHRFFKIFRIGPKNCSGRKGSTKYGPFDILGVSYVYYFDPENKEKFVNFLVRKFLLKNPNPDPGIKNVFSRMLHSNDLHWYGCICHAAKKKLDIRNSTERKMTNSN